MMNSNLERHIGETMAVVLRERLVELEALEASGTATEDIRNRLAFVRKMLVLFDASDLRQDARAGKLECLEW